MDRRTFLGASATTSLLLAADRTALAGMAPAEGRRLSAATQAACQKVLAGMEEKRSETGLSVPREDGQLLQLMAQLLQARRVLELGTFIGYSAIWLAMALEETGGKLVTIEISADRVTQARENVAQAGLGSRVEVLEGDAHVVAKRVEGPLDLVFMDAEKGNEVDYFNTVFPKLRPGGVILLHNAIRYRNQMKPYLELVAGHPEILHVVVSTTLEDGFSLSLKRRL
jgi:predicted O-methyltransferase YrrM